VFAFPHIPANKVQLNRDGRNDHSLHLTKTLTGN